jgi:hypothetical protein
MRTISQVAVQHSERGSSCLTLAFGDRTTRRLPCRAEKNIRHPNPKTRHPSQTTPAADPDRLTIRDEREHEVQRTAVPRRCLPPASVDRPGVTDNPWSR